MREISVTELQAAVSEGATLLDVREPGEYADGHVPGARNVPMAQLQSALGGLERSTPVLLICWSGHRSGAMCDLVTAAGLEAVNISGGTAAWIRAGGSVEAGAR